jgi:hypothetical protein
MLSFDEPVRGRRQARLRLDEKAGWLDRRDGRREESGEEQELPDGS